MANFVFLAPGFEEVEALGTVDVLRRSGMEITTVSILEVAEVVGAHGITVVADTILDMVDFSTADWMILPGGMPGATNLAACEPLTQALQTQNARGGNIAAICASPAVVLAPLGILKGRKATAYPGFEAGLKQGGATPVDARVVVDGNVVTGNGPASVFAFALQIAAEDRGADAAQTVSKGLLYS
ncbi:MAG: DJ-1/PfpI family protein [Bacteroidales bacterium]|nr:DJ-1/PfpI family protein [Bacteroidales bacterium]